MDPTYTREYETFERHHWWFTTRRGIIHQTLKRYVPRSVAGQGRWLDVGCGTGVLLESYPGFAEKIGAETDRGCVARGRERNVDLRLIQPDWDFSELGRFDCVTLCDVLEHIEHEKPALNAVDRVLKPGGTLLVTVPALMSLWSDHDVVNHHYRRYTRHSLVALFPVDKWEIKKASYFCSILFPFIWSVRRGKKLLRKWQASAPSAAAHDLKLGHPFIDGALRLAFDLERPLLRHGNFPVGSSLLLVATKKCD